MGEPVSARPGASGAGAGVLARAALCRLDGPEGIETLDVSWNPSRYALKRTARLARTETLGGRSEPSALAGASEEFRTELFIDTGSEPAERRDGRRAAETLRSWMSPSPGSLLPPRVLFAWGSFRFAGTIEEIEEEWVRFDPDGTPVRGSIRLTLRS